MPQQPEVLEAKVGKNAIDHNKSVSKGNGEISGCHDLTVMMTELKKGLILVRVKNTPACGFPEGVYSLWLTFEKTTEERTKESAAALDKEKYASRRHRKGRKKSSKGEKGETDLQFEENRKGRTAKMRSRQRTGKQSETSGKLPCETEETFAGKPNTTRRAQAQDTAKKGGIVCRDTDKEEGAVGGDTDRVEGAVGGDTDRVEGAVGGDKGENTAQNTGPGHKSTTYDLKILSQIKGDKWEVKDKTVFKPILKTVYDPNNWPEDELKRRCKQAFANALSNDRWKTSQPPNKLEYKDLKDYEVNNFYFIHDTDRIIEEE
ncbi:hypothetical protein Bbelb_370590 [Branchiostoma belcheri]|nr:hypothetical protein Bbelb_370590 [Branchiostoma belcheri]